MEATGGPHRGWPGPRGLCAQTVLESGSGTAEGQLPRAASPSKERARPAFDGAILPPSSRRRPATGDVGSGSAVQRRVRARLDELNLLSFNHPVVSAHRAHPALAGLPDGARGGWAPLGWPRRPRVESRDVGVLGEALRGPGAAEPRTLGERRRPPSGGRVGDSRAWKGSPPIWEAQLWTGGHCSGPVVTALVRNLLWLPSASASQPVPRVTSTPAGQPPQPPGCFARLSSFRACLQYLSPPRCLLGSCLLPGPHVGCPPAAPSSATGPLEPALPSCPQ